MQIFANSAKTKPDAMNSMIRECLDGKLEKETEGGKATQGATYRSEGKKGSHKEGVLPFIDLTRPEDPSKNLNLGKTPSSVAFLI